MTEIGWMRTLTARRVFWQYPQDTTSPHPKDGEGAHSDCFFLPDKFAAQSDLCGTASHDLCLAFNDANDELLMKGVLGQGTQIPFEVVVALDEHALPVAWKIAEQQTEYEGADVKTVLASSDELRENVSDRNVVLCATYIDTDVERSIISLRRKLVENGAQVMDTVFAVVRFKDPSDKDNTFPGRLHALFSVFRARWTIYGTCPLCIRGSKPLVYSETTHGEFFPGAVKQKPVAARAESRRAEVTFA